MFFAIFMLIVLASMVAFVWLAIHLFSGAAKRGHDAVAALLPIVGAAPNPSANAVNGTYSGMPVNARIAEIRPTPNMDNQWMYEYVASMQAGPGGSDWSLSYGGEGLLGTGHKVWHVKAHDEALAQRLNAAGVVDTAAGFGDEKPAVRYDAKTGWLILTTGQKMRANWPAPDAFKRHLDVLAALAAANRQANGPVGVQTNP